MATGRANFLRQFCRRAEPLVGLKKWSKETAMSEQRSKVLLTTFILVLATACGQLASAQTFKPISAPVTLAQVSAGAKTVFALSTTGNPYVFEPSKFVLVSTAVFTQIAVGGGTAVKDDAVWALDAAGKVHKGNLTGTTWKFGTVPGLLSTISVGPGYRDNCHPYEVWGINSANHIFNYDFCTKAFVEVTGGLCGLSTGGGETWGINCIGDVFRYDVPSNSFITVPGVLSQLTVGPNGVYGVNTSSDIFEFHDNTQTFAQISGLLAQVQAGGSGVWGLNSAGAIFRLEGTTGNLSQVPGVLTSISVGTGAGVWGVNSAGKAFAFSVP
jgi:Tectonin domain